MKYVEGRIFKDLKFTGLTKSEIQELFVEQARVLAQLHSFDINQLKL